MSHGWPLDLNEEKRVDRVRAVCVCVFVCVCVCTFECDTEIGRAHV